MRPIPAPRIGESHGLLRAISQRGRVRLDEFLTEFSADELFPPGLENAHGRTRQFISYARSAGLLKEDRGVVELTEIGKRYVRSGDEADPFGVSEGQADWLRRQLLEKHMTDSIYHGLAIGLSLLSSVAPGTRVSMLDFGRSLGYLGRAGWDNDNTLQIQGERYITLLTDLGLIDGERGLTRTGHELKGELTLPIHMSLLDIAGQHNPGGPDAVRAEGEAEWARLEQGAAPQPEPAPAPSPVPATPPPAAPAPWVVGLRPLPLRPDGYGQVLPTPEVLADRRLPTQDRLPPPPTAAFASTVQPVPDDVLRRSTWRTGCPVRVDQLRYLTMSFWGFDGRHHTGEMIVNARVAAAVVSVFGALHAARFPLEEMRVVSAAELDAPPTGDGNDTTAFVCRPARGQTRWSAHAYGLAIDLNPFCNPYLRRDLVLPELASAYLDRGWVRPGMIRPGGAVVRAFTAIGWTWGGTWSSPRDQMHFSATGT
jgi:hypothetical protein